MAADERNDQRVQEHTPRLGMKKLAPDVHKAMINSCNRFSVITRMVPGHYTPAAHRH